VVLFALLSYLLLNLTSACKANKKEKGDFWRLIGIYGQVQCGYQVKIKIAKELGECGVLPTTSHWGKASHLLDFS